jgi:hypothetical protein
VFLAPESGSSGAAWAANARVLEKWAAAEARLAMRRWDVPVYFARETPAVRRMFEWPGGGAVGFWCFGVPVWVFRDLGVYRDLGFQLGFREILSFERSWVSRDLGSLESLGFERSWVFRDLLGF